MTSLGVVVCHKENGQQLHQLRRQALSQLQAFVQLLSHCCMWSFSCGVSAV